jgi:pentatricopeptide repeat protein
MRLPQQISLLALSLSNTHHSHRQGCSTVLFTQSSSKQFDQAIVDEVAANALNLEGELASKQKRSKKRRSNGRLTTRQRSISLGNDPIISLNLNLDHLAKSTQHPASAIRAEEMLLRIEALHSDGYYEKPPDTVSYNCVINSYAHARGVEDRLGNGKRLVERMIDRGIEPNEITYNTLLRCLLKEMEDADGNSMELRQEKVLQAESLISTMEKMNLANTISYNTVISILSKSCLKDSPQRAEYWLRHMMQLFNSTGDEKVEPDVCSFNSAIHAYSNAITDSKHYKQYEQSNLVYAKKADELLTEMETLCSNGQDSVRPDVISYSAVINAYARAASNENEWCADRAVEILEKMEANVSDIMKKEVEKKSVKPNKKTYTGVSA